MRVLVVGAGISGLATASFLQHGGARVTVLEASDRVGGNVTTDRSDGRLIDRAANGWLDSEPAMNELLDLAGLRERLVPASDRYSVRWIHADGRMQPAPMSPPAMVKSQLISWGAKLRLLLEPFIGRAKGPETVAQFVRRRLGQAFVDRMVGPMVAGIYAADPERLSLKAAFPRMAELEAEHRSLFVAMMRLRRGGAPRGHLQTMDEGAGALPEALAARLDVRTGVRVTRLEPREYGWTVHTSQGVERADAVVLACPAFVQAELVEDHAPELAGELAGIAYAPVAVVATVWPADAWERTPDGFGVLVARGEDLGVLGCLFTSNIFPNQAGPDELLLRTIIGGAVDPDAARGSQDELLARADRAHRQLFGACRAQPLVQRVYQHERGIPQYEPGHEDRVARIRALEQDLSGLALTGNHLEGIGVKDCAKAGKLVAERLLRSA